MSTYRIYALIHGQILYEGRMFDCHIKKMSFSEQKKRRFAPIKGVFSEDDGFHQTYVTPLPYIEPIKIKSEHIVICDIEEDRPGNAIGGAVRKIDKLCRFLTITNMQDMKNKYGEKFGHVEPYIYQVNKVYLLTPDGGEKQIRFKLKGGLTYLPDRPESNEWRHPETKQFLEDIFNFHDDTLQRSIKYLYRSAIGPFLLDSQEKIALDHFKSIEIIVESLSSEDKSFKNQLDEASTKIGLTEEERLKIEELWGYRSSYGDIAHPSKYDQAERYPNQFPIPSNVHYPAFLDSTAGKVFLKYFHYKRRVYFIEIKEPFSSEYEDVMHEVNPGLESNQLLFQTNEKHKDLLKQKIRKAFIKRYGITTNDIESMKFDRSKEEVILTVKVKL